MSTFTVILWALVALFGIPMIITGVALRLTNDLLKDSDTMKVAQFIPLSFERLPWFVKLAFRRKRGNLIELGFTELSTFSRSGLGIPNFSTILISKDKTTIAELSYVRLGLLTQIVLLFVMPSKFFIHLFGIYGLVLSTVFKTENYRRFSTTKLKFLSEDSMPKEKEYLVVKKTMTLEEMIIIHVAEAEKIASTESLQMLKFETLETYYEYERFVLKKLSGEQRATAEESLRQISSDNV